MPDTAAKTDKRSHGCALFSLADAVPTSPLSLLTVKQSLGFAAAPDYARAMDQHKQAMSQHEKDHADWTARGEARDKQLAGHETRKQAIDEIGKLYATDAGADHSATWKDVTAKVKDLAEKAGFTDKFTARLEAISARGESKISGVQAKVDKANDNLSELAELRKSLGERPAEPEEPEAPDPDKFGDDEEGYYKADADHDKLMVEHNKAMAVWEKASDKWDVATEKLDAKEESVTEKRDTALSDLDEAYSDHLHSLDEVITDGSEKATEAIEKEAESLSEASDKDEEPEAPAEPEEDHAEKGSGDSSRTAAEQDPEHPRGEDGKFIDKTDAGSKAAFAWTLEPVVAARRLSLSVPNDELVDKGREQEPHVTVLYGFHPEVDADAIAAIVSAVMPVRIRFGGVSVFSQPDQDVLKVEVISPDLHLLRQKLAVLPHTSSYPVYQPHMTLAYVKPGCGEAYVGKSGLEGLELVLNKITFSDVDRNKVVIPLADPSSRMVPTADFLRQDMRSLRVLLAQHGLPEATDKAEATLLLTEFFAVNAADASAPAKSTVADGDVTEVQVREEAVRAGIQDVGSLNQLTTAVSQDPNLGRQKIQAIQDMAKTLVASGQITAGDAMGKAISYGSLDALKSVSERDREATRLLTSLPASMGASKTMKELPMRGKDKKTASFRAAFSTRLEFGLVPFTEAARAVRHLAIQSPLSVLQKVTQTTGDVSQCAAALAEMLAEHAGGSLNAPLVLWKGKLSERQWLAGRLASRGAIAAFTDSLLTSCTSWRSELLSCVLAEMHETLETREQSLVRMPDGRRMPRREAVLFFAADGMDADEAIAAAEELPGVAYARRGDLAPAGIVGFSLHTDGAAPESVSPKPQNLLQKWRKAAAQAEAGDLTQAEMASLVQAIAPYPVLAERVAFDLDCGVDAHSQPQQVMRHLTDLLASHASEAAMRLHGDAGLRMDPASLSLALYEGKPRTRGWIKKQMASQQVPVHFAQEYLDGIQPFVAPVAVVPEALPTAWLAAFAEDIAEGNFPDTHRAGTLRVARMQSSGVAFDQYATGLQHVVQEITARFQDGEICTTDWHGALCEVLAPAAFQAALAARGGKRSFLSPEAWSLARERSLGLLNSLAVFADESGVRGKEWVSHRAPLFAALAHGDLQEQRRLFAREQGAMWERRLLPVDGACCMSCEKAASVGWAAVGSMPEIGACKCLSNCGCRFVFARGEEDPGTQDNLPAGMVGFDADWVPLFDLAFFAWDESKYIRGPDGRFIGFATFVGSTYKAMKAENAEQGLQPPTKAELMEKVKQRMGHWSDDKFHSVLGKSIDKELISPGIHTRQAFVSGENQATRALSGQIASLIKMKQDPDVASKGLFGNLMKLSPEEVSYIHNRLGLTAPPAGDSKGQLAGNILYRAKAAAGDTGHANSLAEEIQDLKKPDAAHEQLANVENIKDQLKSMSIHELGHLAGKLMLADALPEKFQKNLADAGATAGQMVLARNADNAADMRKLIATEIDKAAAGLAQKKADADETAMATKMAPVLKEFHSQISNPDLDKHVETLGSINHLLPGEKVYLAKAMGLSEGVISPSNADAMLHLAVNDSYKAKVKEMSGEHLAAIKHMVDMGDFSKMEESFGKITQLPDPVKIAIAQALHLSVFQTSSSVLPSADKAVASIAGYLNDNKKIGDDFQMEHAKGVLKGIINKPDLMVMDGVVPPSVQKSIDTIMEGVAKQPLENIKAIAKHLGLPTSTFGGTTGLIKSISNKVRNALNNEIAKQGKEKIDSEIKSGVDCSKLIFWGKPAKECGSAADVVAGLKSQGGAHVLAAYDSLKAELNLPDLTKGGMKAISEAEKNLKTLLVQKESEFKPEEIKPTPPEAGSSGGSSGAALPEYKKLPSIAAELSKHNVNEVEPTWNKKDLPGGSQFFGGAAFSPSGKIMLHMDSFGSWSFPKSSGSSLNAPNGAVSGVKSKTGISGEVVGLVPGNYASPAGNSNYFVMQAKDEADGVKAKWFTPQEAEEAIKSTLTAVPSKMEKELEILKNSQEAYAKLLNGGKQMPKGTVGMPNSAGDLADLQKVKSLGGSTGALLMKDDADNQYVMKKGDSAGHVKEEFAADQAYAAAGFPTPKMKLIDTPQGPVKLSEYIDGLKPINEALSSGTQAMRDKIGAAARSGFVMDAVMGNWDVVGASFDNMMVGPDGKVYRIDNGGSLRYRAMGAKKDAKDFGEGVPEMETMRDGTNQNATKIFGGISDGEIAGQIKDLLANKSKILAALPEEVRGTVSKRIDWVAANYIKAAEQIPGTATTEKSGKESKWPGGDPSKSPSWHATPEEIANSPTFKKFGDDEVRMHISVKELPASFMKHVEEAVAKTSSQEKSAVTKYTGSGVYGPLNAALRKCPETADCLDGEQKAKFDKIGKALAKQGVLETPITVWRHFPISKEHGAEEFLPMMQKAMAEGRTVKIPGFKSCSTSPTRTYNFGGHSSAYSGSISVALEIKAKTGGFVKSISSVGSEDEFLQPHGCRYKVVGVKEIAYDPGYGQPVKRMTYQLEEI